MSEESWFVQNLHLILELLIAIIGLITAIIGGKTLYKKYKSKKIASITESPLANIQQVERAETVVGPQINIQVSDVEGVAAIKEIFSNKKSLVRASVGRVGRGRSRRPDLFVMWDSEIRKNYHKLHQNKWDTIDQCYVEFLKQTQEIARGLLHQRSAEEIWKMHPIHSIEPQLVELFSRASVKSLPKMIDECNYVRFRLGKDF